MIYTEARFPKEHHKEHNKAEHNNAEHSREEIPQGCASAASTVSRFSTAIWTVALGLYVTIL